MSAKTKKPVEVAETAALSYVLGVTSAASLGRSTLKNLAKLLVPSILATVSVNTLSDITQSGVYRINGGSTEIMPDGKTDLSYSTVIAFCHPGGDKILIIIHYTAVASVYSVTSNGYHYWKMLT